MTKNILQPFCILAIIKEQISCDIHALNGVDLGGQVLAEAVQRVAEQRDLDRVDRGTSRVSFPIKEQWIVTHHGDAFGFRPSHADH